MGRYKCGLVRGCDAEEEEEHVGEVGKSIMVDMVDQWPT